MTSITWNPLSVSLFNVRLNSSEKFILPVGTLLHLVKLRLGDEGLR